MAPDDDSGAISNPKTASAANARRTMMRSVCTNVVFDSTLSRMARGVYGTQVGRKQGDEGDAGCATVSLGFKSSCSLDAGEPRALRREALGRNQRVNVA